MKQNAAKITLGIIAVLVVLIVLTYISVGSTDETFRTCDLMGIDDPDSIDFREFDSVTLAPSRLYEGNLLKELMQGEQYREEWSTPVTVPLIFLDTLYGGMKVIEEGGGKQTHSLELEDPKGIRHTLRSVTKDPDPLIPEFAKSLGLENIVVDGISAQHPFGALAAAALSEAVGILHTHPKMVFVPKQEVLGEYNEKYGNRLYLLEYESEGKVDWTGTENAIEIMDTDDLQELKEEYPDQTSISVPAFIRARLFDMLIGDWDRHAKQWGWVVQKKSDTYVAYPLAGDRDNAFFSIDGLIPAIITNQEILPKVQSFQETIDYLPGLVLKADRYFLYDVPEEMYIQQARYLQEVLTDSVIRRAFDVWPEQIYALNGEQIVETIIQRRQDLTEYAVEFKKIIDEKGLLEEPLTGSEDEEFETWLMKCFECRE